MSHDEKVDNALRFLGALVKPEQGWLVASVRAEIVRLRKLARRKRVDNATKAS
jgi:hypothetical protein